MDGHLSGIGLNGDGQRASQKGLSFTDGKFSGLAVCCYAVDGQVVSVKDNALCIFGRFDVLGGGTRYGPGVEINGGIPIEVGNPRLLWVGVAVVVDDLIHGAYALCLGGGCCGILGSVTTSGERAKAEESGRP